MLTRKGLEALAEGIRDAAREAGLNPEVIAGPIVAELRAAGVVTPAFDPARFTAALLK